MHQFSSARAQMECRPGEGAPSGSFFLIKDGIGADCGGGSVAVTRSVKSAAFLATEPPQPPRAGGSLSLPSVSPHQQGSRGGQVLPP